MGGRVKPFRTETLSNSERYGTAEQRHIFGGLGCRHELTAIRCELDLLGEHIAGRKGQATGAWSKGGKGETGDCKSGWRLHKRRGERCA